MHHCISVLLFPWIRIAGENILKLSFDQYGPHREYWHYVATRLQVNTCLNEVGTTKATTRTPTTDELLICIYYLHNKKLCRWYHPYVLLESVLKLVVTSLRAFAHVNVSTLQVNDRTKLRTHEAECLCCGVRCSHRHLFSNISFRIGD